MTRGQLLLMVGVLGTTPGWAAKPDTVELCHKQGDTYRLITINEKALAAHLRHGDGFPGDLIPGLEPFRFGPNCEIDP